jgi:CO/xanthine dehydrogenase FAD-binding subunit
VVQRYVFPETIQSCLGELERHSGQARIIAGGTDLVLVLRRGEHPLSALFDITRISELEGITEETDHIRLGARVTHGLCASSPLIRRSVTCLAEACSSIGSPQVRHIGTVVGNVVNAQPAADCAIALTAIGAEARIVSTQGERAERVEDLYKGIGQSRVESTRELLSEICVPLIKPGEGSAFLRVAPRNVMGLPVLNGAAWISLREHLIGDVRIALGPVSYRPFRPRKTEAILRGSRWDHAGMMDEACRAASEEATPRDSLLRGSASYRRKLIQSLTRRLLELAIGRARHDLTPLASASRLVRR